MKRFCKECGKEAKQNHKVCVHCGTPLVQTRAEQKAATKTSHSKKPMPRKTKIVWGIAIGIFALLIGVHMWANSYLSKESVENKFEVAIKENDPKTLAKLLVHEDGSSISTEEAEAFMKLVKDEGKGVLDGLFEISFDHKLFGIYDTYKVEVIDQFVYYDDRVDDLTFSFNNQKVSEFEWEEDYTTYGPLAPGIYSIEATFKGEYGETTAKDTVTLAYDERNYTQIGQDIPISKVTFYVENYEQFDVSQAHILIDDQKIAISDEGTTEEVGPLILGGSQTVKTVVTMPWGEVTSDEIPVEYQDISLVAALITQEQYEDVTDLLKDFGDQYVHARATESTKPIKVASADVKQDLADTFNDIFFYSGQIESIQINKDSIFINVDSETPEIYLETNFIIKEDDHQATEEPDLYEEDYLWEIGLKFNEEAKEWTIISVGSISSWPDFSDADEVVGSKKLYGPSEETIEKEKTKALESTMADFVAEYTYASVEAINLRDFSLMEAYLTDDGPRYKEAKDYIDYLDSKDIYEDWYGTNLEKLEKVDDEIYKVTVIEEFNIIKPDSSDIKEFRTVLHVKIIDGSYFVDELIETNEI